MHSREIREQFLKYFEKKGHTRVASSSLIPHDDPTLYFTNAGMVQFKELFLGYEKRNYVRAATSQKCMRVSGKHNDLENVGTTPRHHTFFEMLGNFSFGDYFKEEAIAYAWEFLTEVVKLPKEKLYITIFEKDDEAETLWLKHVSKDRIFRLGEKDNFWSMGETGPCGPCSEIHWDFGSGSVKKEDLSSDRFMEIWNLVFMQCNRSSDGTMTPLPKPSVDTGMGLERLSCVLQGKKSNWETDLFVPIIKEIKKVVGTHFKTHPPLNPLPSREGKIDVSDESSQFSVAMRVIADHVRAATFLIADGLFPSNEGRGYVLRRILRRAIRYARSLEMQKPFFAEISQTVIREMEKAYPELVQHREIIEKVLTNEESKFLETLERGMEILEEEFAVLKNVIPTKVGIHDPLKKLDSGFRRNDIKSTGKIVPGGIVFKLYDTYGFPKDLTELIARERGFSIDENGFDEAMEEQRQRARKAWKGSGAVKTDPIFQKMKGEGVRTDFVGYEKENEDGCVLRLIKDGKIIDHAKVGEEIQLVTDKTPFYAESGGQVGDTGFGANNDIEIQILDTQKPFADLFVHQIKIVSGELTPKQILQMQVNSERRQKIRLNHSATHLIHHALREILGTHVKQAGSYLDDHHLRFDFSHFEAIREEQLADIEQKVNQMVTQNLKVKTLVLPYPEAIAQGALAFFGEKYGDVVRLVDIGGISKELCGGTHVVQTGEIGLIEIVRERSVASGVRRVEVVTGEVARQYQKPSVVDAPPKKEKKKTDISQVLASLGDFTKMVQSIKGVSLVARQISAEDAGALREVADQIRQKISSGIVVLGSEIEGKVALVVMISKDLTSKYNAGKIMKILAEKVGGTGGGRPDMAQGGGPEVSLLPKTLDSVVTLL